MNVMNTIVVFMMVWWVVLFMMLPVGVRVDANPESGHASSAPKNPRIAIKMLVTTAITVVITGFYFFLLESGYLDFLSFRQK